MVKRIFQIFDSVELLVHKSLSSRKFMASAAAFMAAMHEHNLGAAAGVAVAYVLTEGVIDLKNKA